MAYPLAEELLARIRSRVAAVCVVGLGYVGLPLAETFASGGYPLIGFDIDAEKIHKLQRGESYIGHISSQRVLDLMGKGHLRVSADERCFGDADVIIICVPTPLTAAREPDLSFIENTGRSIARHLRRGQLVILESTTYPGTTVDLLRPILEAGGLRAGQDFFLAFSPEREDPGNQQFTTRNIPKVVGGFDAASRDLAMAVYAPVVQRVVPVSSTQVAEACKILENTYRAVNVALVNELKLVFHEMGIDIWEVIDAAKTKPFGFQAFYPGPGLGGHCIPIDPFYLTWVAHKFGVSTRFIELAGEINTGMPQYVVRRVTQALNDDGKAIKGSRICLLGVAYKANVDDTRESPAFTILELLQRGGATVSYSDPHIPVLPRVRRHDIRLNSEHLTEAFVATQDCLVIVTAHAAFDFASILRHARLVVDTRNATRGFAGAACRIVKA